MIEAVLIANENGLPIYSKIFREDYIDPNLVLSFFSALKTFARSLTKKENYILRSINLGKSLLDFESASFEHIGQVDVLIISKGLAPSTSHAVLSQITELFTIWLDEYFFDHPITNESMKVGLFPDFSDFDVNLNMILESLKTEEFYEIDMQLNIPNKILNKINALFTDQQIGEMYNCSETQLLEQIFNEYSHKDLEKDLKSRFRKNKFN